MTSYRIRAYMYLLIVVVLWGTATPIIKFTLNGIGPFSFLTYRFFLAGIFGALALPFLRIGRKAIKDNFWEIILYGFVTTTLTLGLLFLGLNRTTVLDTILIATISPLVIALFGEIFLKEHITSRERLGIGIAFVGTFLTVLEPLLSGGFDGFRIIGNLLVVGYLISNAISVTLAKKLVRKDVPSLSLTNISFIVGFITLLPLVLLEKTPQNLVHTAINLSLPYQIGVFYMAFLSGTLAYALWVKGQKSIEISEAGVFSYLQPIFAAPLAVFWLGEKITSPFILGAIIITIGVFIAEYKKKAKSSN